MAKKLSRTMTLSIIGVLAIVFLAPLSFAGAMYMNDQGGADPLGEKAFWWLNDDDDLVNTNDVVASKPSTHDVGYYYLGGSGIRNYTTFDYLLYEDGVNEFMITQGGAQVGAGTNFIHFQLNMTVNDLVKSAVDGIEFYINTPAEYSTPYDMSLSFAYDVAGTAHVDAIDVDVIPFNDTQAAYPIDDNSSIIYATIDPLSLNAAKWAAVDYPANTVIVTLVFEQEVNFNGEVVEFSLGLHSSDISPYTMMDTVAMCLGGLFIVGAVFATPYVGSKGIRRR